MYHSIFCPKVQNRIRHLKQADIVIGVPSHKNRQQTIQIAKTALAGAEKYYPDLCTVLMNADSGFNAETHGAIVAQLGTSSVFKKVIGGQYSNNLGYGSAVASILDAALALDAKAIIILDSHTLTMTASWIPALAHLILSDNADLVVPRYQWLLPDSALSDLVVYPLFRAMWGVNLRHPCAPDFCLSARLAASLLDEDIWQTDAAGTALPTWLASYAAVNRWPIAQTAIGEKERGLSLDTFPKNGTEFPMSAEEFQHKKNYSTNKKQSNGSVGSPIPEIEISNQIIYSQTWFQQTMSVMFSLARYYRQQWLTMNKVQPVSTLTQFASPTRRISTPLLDTTYLLDKLALDWIKYRYLWQQILTPNNLSQLEAVAALSPTEFYFPPNLWTRVIYDFIVAFNRSELDPRQITKSLFPIYLGRLAAYWQEIAGLSAIGREGTVAAQAMEFEELRDYLKLRWRTYELY